MDLSLKPGAHLYFMGIGGTGMAAVAGLMQEAGFHISGSDKGVYPPMSHMLADLKIPVQTPYGAANLTHNRPDLIIVANALSRGNEEIEYMLAQELAYTSFPALLGATVLAKKRPIVVTGTHGKTTTTTLLAHMLDQLNEQPGFLVGGLPRNFPRSFRLGDGEYFVIEGDEYDTAFFDKESKFLHYRPHYLVINNLEFDHADIFSSIEDIEAMFLKAIDKVDDKSRIIANLSDAGVAKMLQKAGLAHKVTGVSTQAGALLGTNAAALTKVVPGKTTWHLQVDTKQFGRVPLETTLAGEHNMANLTQVIGLLATIAQQESKKWTASDLSAATASFTGVARRLDFLGEAKGVKVYEDFAHHPTAIKKVIDGMRKADPHTKLVVAFEPVNATGRRNILLAEFADALSSADAVWLGKCPVDERIPIEQRMSTATLANGIGAKAKFFDSNEDLLIHALGALKPNTTILFMSPGSFSGIQHALVEKLMHGEGKTVDPSENAYI